jgi:hypothetical protein
MLKKRAKKLHLRRIVKIANHKANEIMSAAPDNNF